MADDQAAPITAQELLTDALERYGKARAAYMGNSLPEVPRVAAMAAAVQAEQLTRIADALERLAGCVDSDGPTFVTRVAEDSTVATALDKIERALDSMTAGVSSGGYALRTVQA